MPIVAMERMTGPAFEAWYTKHRKGKSLEGAAFMALSKEDKVKARRVLKHDVTKDKIHDLQKKLIKKVHEGMDWPDLMKFFNDHIGPLIDTPDLFPHGGAEELEMELIDEIREERKIYKSKA